jgi:hypothetical protein
MDEKTIIEISRMNKASDDHSKRLELLRNLPEVVISAETPPEEAERIRMEDYHSRISAITYSTMKFIAEMNEIRQLEN